MPLRGNYDESKFKLYFADTGLLISSLDDEAQEDLRVNKNLGVYKGALYENFVAEALKKQGYDLYYYKKDNSTLEEDFFLRTQDELIPVEVKSNTKGSKSLEKKKKNGNYSDISHGIKLTAGNRICRWDLHVSVLLYISAEKVSEKLQVVSVASRQLLINLNPPLTLPSNLISN